MNEIATLIMMALWENQRPLRVKDLVHHRNVKHICPIQIALCMRELRDNQEIKIYYTGVYADGSETQGKWYDIEEFFASDEKNQYKDLCTYLEMNH